MSASTFRQQSYVRNVVDSHSRDAGVCRTETPARTNVGFPRDARLLQGKDYSRAFKRNRRIADNCFTILVHRRDDRSPARLGLAIAKKRARRAVDRNRIKRVTRESFRHARNTLRGLDLVVMNRDGTASAGSAELRSSLDQLWIRASRAAQRQDR